METQTQQGVATATDPRTTWTIDPADSTIGFSVKHMMFTTVHGRFGGVSGTNPWGGEVAGYEATTKISRKDFGMAFNVPLAEGGFLVGDEVKIAIDLEAVRQG